MRHTLTLLVPVESVDSVHELADAHAAHPRTGRPSPGQVLRLVAPYCPASAPSDVPTHYGAHTPCTPSNLRTFEDLAPSVDGLLSASWAPNEGAPDLPTWAATHGLAPWSPPRPYEDES